MQQSRTQCCDALHRKRWLEEDVLGIRQPFTSDPVCTRLLQGDRYNNIRRALAMLSDRGIEVPCCCSSARTHATLRALLSAKATSGAVRLDEPCLSPILASTPDPHP